MPASLDAGSGANVAAPLSDEQLRATLEKWEQGTRWPLIAEVGPITHELLALRSALRAASDREAALRSVIRGLHGAAVTFELEGFPGESDHVSCRYPDRRIGYSIFDADTHLDPVSALSSDEQTNG